MGRIYAICHSEKKGTAKSYIESIEIVQNFGLKGDAHGGDWHRQVSLMSKEKIDAFKNRGGKVEIGGFGENLIVEGDEFLALKVGDIVKTGDVVLEITQLGKECHTHCQIYYTVGECIMPKEGVFARVLSGGKITVGDEISL
ncbi:MAG: MOSC domain-containing protein [Fusobacteriaceae bacterium]